MSTTSTISCRDDPTNICALYVLLQGWGLSDRDMSQLYPLQQLCQLTIKSSDPWLLSDAALQQLPDELPLLSSIIRDGQQLLSYGTRLQAATGFGVQAGVPAGPADAASSYCGHSSAAAVRAGLDSSAGGASSSYQGIWQGPQVALSGDAQLGTQLIESPWLLRYLPQTRCPSVTSSKVQQQRTTPASRSVMRQGPGDKAGANRRGSGSGGTVYQRLSAYDERYKYSSGELLALRDACVGQGTAVVDVGQSPGSNSSSSSRRSSASDAPTDLLEAVPAEIRAGAR
jgi:hypothetical protein